MDNIKMFITSVKVHVDALGEFKLLATGLVPLLVVTWFGSWATSNSDSVYISIALVVMVVVNMAVARQMLYDNHKLYTWAKKVGAGNRRYDIDNIIIESTLWFLIAHNAALFIINIVEVLN